MATEPQERVYRAACPGCGAPVEFRSAQSTHAVCGYCQSTVVRSGETLARIGKMAELFDDHSPLQLMASGKFGEQAFTLVGRLQYKSTTGVWTEWNALLPDGTTASLSEDNGAYVFMRAQPMQQRELPAAEHFRVGATTAINGKSFSVAFNEPVTLLSAQGELPKLPPAGHPFAMVELRNEQGEVLSIDYGMQPPEVSLGHAVLLEALQLTGLRDDNAKEEKGRQFHCPNCGAQIEVALSGTKSITCRSCNSLIDMSQGIGGELTHVTQDEPVQPLIALGSTGQLQGVHWQVVGFQHRMGVEPGDDEHFGWDEYLLYNRKRGFTFLVDSTEGWSVVKPATGAPKMVENGQSASYLGKRYQLQSTYNAETTYVAGEFYWPVHRGQKTSNRDFAKDNSLLSLEQTPTEVTWSVGGKIESDAVAKAFKLEGKQELLKRSDAAPVSKALGMGCGMVVLLLVVMLVVMLLFSRCSSCDPRYENCSSSSSSRSSGGSFGGSSSGGGHK